MCVCFFSSSGSFFFISFNSQTIGWDVPHGNSLQARCKDLGIYKLLGETRVLCSNGLWAPRMPSCVPTTLLTNFSGNLNCNFHSLVAFSRSRLDYQNVHRLQNFKSTLQINLIGQNLCSKVFTFPSILSVGKVLVCHQAVKLFL